MLTEEEKKERKKLSNLKYYSKNKEKVRALNSKWKANNPEKDKAYQKNYRERVKRRQLEDTTYTKLTLAGSESVMNILFEMGNYVRYFEERDLNVYEVTIKHPNTIDLNDDTTISGVIAKLSTLTNNL